MTVSSQNTKLQAALTVIKAAQGKAANKEYQPALEKYELALGALIPLLQNEVNNVTLFANATLLANARVDNLTDVTRLTLLTGMFWEMLLEITSYLQE